MPPPPTRRLGFREMSTDDLDDMTGLLGDRQVMEFYPHPKGREATSEWIAWNVRNYAAHGYGLWMIETHDGQFIGDCGLTWQTVNGSPHLEIGYHVSASAQGHGLATEAAAACRDYARTRALSSTLIAIIHEDNLASWRVAEKIGMSRDRSLKHSSPVHLVAAMDLSVPQHHGPPR